MEYIENREHSVTACDPLGQRATFIQQRIRPFIDAAAHPAPEPHGAALTEEIGPPPRRRGGPNNYLDAD